jgi:hypothetical protein
MLRTRPELGTGLLVELAVTLDKSGLQRIDDHRSRLIEALSGLVHAQAKGGEFPPRQAAAKAEAEPALAQHVEHGRILGDAQRIVPRQDDSRGAQIDVRAERGQIRHQLDVVGHERVVVEVVLGRPQAVEPQVSGEPRQPDLLVPYSYIGAAVPTVAGEHHHHADIHRRLLRSVSLARS